MSGQYEQMIQQASTIREMFVNEAFSAAQQVQQQAQSIQAQSQSVPQRAPVESAAPFFGPGAADSLFWVGLGAVGALGLAYFLMKRGD